jgi:hypothetical protein
MITYSTNWMGPVSLHWYRARGLTQVKHHVGENDCMLYKAGEAFTSETITTHYSCGRIDVHNVPNEPYGDEISVPPMLSTDWAMFGNWLDTVQTMSVWTLADLVTAYEQHNPPITWATE